MYDVEIYSTNLLLITQSTRLTVYFDEICALLHYDLTHLAQFPLNDINRLLGYDLLVVDVVNASAESQALWGQIIPAQVPVLWVTPNDSNLLQAHVLRNPFTQQQAIHIIQRLLQQSKHTLQSNLDHDFLKQLLLAPTSDHILQYLSHYLQQKLPLRYLGVLVYEDDMQAKWVYWNENPPPDHCHRLIQQTQQDKSLPAGWQRYAFRADEMIGIIFMQWQHPLTNVQHQHLLDTVQLAARAWARAVMLQDNQQRLSDMKVYDLIGRAIVAQTDPQEVLQMIVNGAQSSLNAESIVLWLRRKQHLVAVAQSGQPTPIRPYVALNEANLLTQTMQSRYPISQTDADFGEHNHRIYPQGALRQTVCVPLLSHKQTIGVIQANNPASRQRFTLDSEWRLRYLAAWSVIAINNSELHHRTQTALQRERATRTQLIAAEKLTALGRLVASVAHEVNNPLQIAQSALEFMQQKVQHHAANGEQWVRDIQDDLVTLQESVDQIYAVIDNLRSTYRVNNEARAVNINELIQNVADMVSYQLRQNHLSLTLQLDPDLPSIPCVAHEIRQVLLNLILNAIDATDDNGTIIVTTRHIASEKAIIIIVQDSGQGIPDDILSSIFEPFFTTKRKGSGLGLAISRNIIEQHKGRISVASVPHSGSKFMVWLPVM